jgi:HEAT repeat protein
MRGAFAVGAPPIEMISPQAPKPPSPTIVLGAVVFAAMLLPAFSATAQISSNDVRQRYQKSTSSSANIDEQVRKLRSEDPLERMEGVKGLHETNDSKAFEFLIQAIGDKDVRVRVKALEALADMKATVATPVLVQHLFLVTTETQMKQRILAALGKIGDPAAARPIAELLQRDLDPATRGTAIYALGDIASTESTATLEKIAETDDSATLRRLANESLAKVRQHQEARAREAKGPQETFLEPREPQ